METQYGMSGLQPLSDISVEKASGLGEIAKSSEVKKDDEMEKWLPLATGGKGLSSIGASVGGMVAGPGGAVAGSLVGSGTDMLVEMWTAGETRAKERRERLKVEMANNKINLQAKKQKQLQERLNAEDRAYTQEVRGMNLEDAKMNQALARANRFRQVASYYQDKVYGSSFNRGLTND